MSCDVNPSVTSHPIPRSDLLSKFDKATVVSGTSSDVAICNMSYFQLPFVARQTTFATTA